MASEFTDQKWYSIAEQASTEMDPEKLTILVAQLCRALDDAKNHKEGRSSEAQRKLDVGTP